MKLLNFIFTFYLLFAFSLHAFAAGCQSWSSPEKIGVLNQTIHEDSGMTSSLQYPDRLYHINDSGSAGEFYITDFTGHLLRTVSVRNFTPWDAEDMSYGLCGEEKCLFIGDIGDNLGWRSTISVVAIAETISFLNEVPQKAFFKFKYEDHQAHNAEAMAIHPNGDLLIATKDFDKKNNKALVSRIFWISAHDLWTNIGRTQILKEIGQLDMATLLNEPIGADPLITSMSISPAGDRFTILTYDRAVEFNFDILTGLNRKLSSDDFSVASTLQLPQQESITYLPAEDAIVYTSEGVAASLYKVRCESRSLSFTITTRQKASSL